MTPTPTVTALTVDAKGLSALLSGVSIRTIRTWDAAGIIPAHVRIGGKVFWRVEEIRLWLEAGSPSRETWNEIRSAKRR